VLARRQQQLKLLRERQKEEEARARARELEQTAIKSKFAGAVQGRVNQVGCGRASNQPHTHSPYTHTTPPMRLWIEGHAAEGSAHSPCLRFMAALGKRALV
jgi:hypothetical protein